jgi:hypothetical protein
VITAIEAGALTIAPRDGGGSVTGKIVPQRTRVFLNGRAAGAAELRLADGARAELALDDVWLVVSAQAR